jgi:signal transduction histidine kinase
MGLRMAKINSRLIHDLRNPLNTISVNAELGKLTLERTGDIHKAISVFEIILAECRQCSSAIDELGNELVKNECDRGMSKDEARNRDGDCE